MADNEEIQFIRNLENAAQVMLAAPNQVTEEQRHQAEEVFQSFHKTTGPYVVCKKILETSHNDYVLFQASSVIKLAIVREWSALDAHVVESLRIYLLRFVMDHAGISNYVRESCVQTVAVIYKRASLDRPTDSPNQLFTEIAQLIHSGNLAMQLVACSVLSAILNEFSSTSTTSRVGLTWEFHYKCKVQFEQTDLKLVFTYCLQTLLEICSGSEDAELLKNEQLATVLGRFLTITEQILSWEFSPTSQRFVGCFSSSTVEFVSFRPPASWKDVILNRSIVDMMFTIHKKFRGNCSLSTQSLQCLDQLASTNGSIFTRDEMQIEYLTYFIDSLLGLLSSIVLFNHEILGIANIINSLVTFSPLPTLIQLNHERLASFLNCLAKMTCSFCQAAANEISTGSEESICLEAFEKTLDAWRKFVNCANDLPPGAIRQHSLDIFDTYLRCHLAPPAGSRVMSNDEETASMDENDDDKDNFVEQLVVIGSFGRHVPDYSIPLLTRLLDERIATQREYLRALQQRGEEAEEEGERHKLNENNEDLHWLLLLTASVLTDVADGETPLIPASIMSFSLSLESSSNVTGTTLKTLSTTECNATSDITVDPVVRLMSSVFRLSTTEEMAISAGLGRCLSPQVGRSLIQFFTRWIESYLAPSEAYYSQISRSFDSSFGADTESGLWTASFLLNKVLSNLTVWHFETDLVMDTIGLLTALAEKPNRGNLSVRCRGMWKIVESFSTNQHPFNILPPTARRNLCRALVLASSAKFVNDERITYMQKVLQSIATRFQAVVSRPDIHTACHEDAVKSELEGLLDCFSGIAEAATPGNSAELFAFLSPMLAVSVSILDLYHNYQEVVQLVLEVFSVTTKQMTCYISEADSVTLFTISLSVMQVYSKHNIGRRCVREHGEEEQFDDLIKLMQIMTNMLCKDFISFAQSDDSKGTVSAADVVIYGLQLIIPLMTSELLMFPGLSSCFVSLVSYMAEIHPGHICHLPDDVFKRLMASIELCLTKCGTDVVKSCMEFLTSLSSHIFQDKSLHGTEKHTAGSHFLKILFNMLLLETFDMDLTETFSAAYFVLICCHQEQYSILVNELLSTYACSIHYQRLVDAFNALTGSEANSPISLNRASRLKFAHGFDRFLVNIRGVLCIR